ncbi:MAG: TylF/MycF/NovP-related O-methyltransferase [Spirochaetales bacterium]
MPDQSQTNTTRSQGRTYPAGYGQIEPVSNYRPWDVDQEFQEIYAKVTSNTMVDQFRLWTLWFLAKQLPAGDLLEVGSWKGGSGAVLARAVSVAGGANPVVLADTFRGVVKATEHDTYYKGGEHANTSRELVQAFLQELGHGETMILEGVFPDETAEQIAERQFAMCHIDVDVYQSARDVFEWVWPRMVTGGVVVFDDYGFYGCEGVTKYVLELATTEVVVVPSLTGQAIIQKSSLA